MTDASKTVDRPREQARLAVGITGASGVVYGLRTLDALRELGRRGSPSWHAWRSAARRCSSCAPVSQTAAGAIPASVLSLTLLYNDGSLPRIMAASLGYTKHVSAWSYSLIPMAY